MGGCMKLEKKASGRRGNGKGRDISRRSNQMNRMLLWFENSRSVWVPAARAGAMEQGGDSWCFLVIKQMKAKPVLKAQPPSFAVFSLSLFLLI